MPTTNESITQRIQRLYLTTAQAALVLDVTPSQVREWDNAGKYTSTNHERRTSYGRRKYRLGDLIKLHEEGFC